jgi:hypothetical protein
VSGVGAGLLGLLGSGPGNRVLEWMAPGLGGGLEGGGSLGLIIMLVSVLVKVLLRQVPLPRISWEAGWRGLRQGLRSGAIIAVLIGLFSIGVFSIMNGLSNGLARGISAGLFGGLVIGLMMGLIAGLSDQQEHQSSHESHFSDRLSLSDRLLTTLFFAFCAGLGFGSVDAWFVGEATPIVLLYGSVVSLFYGITFGVAGGTKLQPDLGRDIRPAESVAWSWSMVGKHAGALARKGLLLGLVVMGSAILPIGGASAAFHGLAYGLRYGLIYSLILGFVAAVAATLVGVLGTGWSTTTLSEQSLFHPNEGIHRSLKHALFAALLFGPCGGMPVDCCVGEPSV